MGGTVLGAQHIHRNSVPFRRKLQRSRLVCKCTQRGIALKLLQMCLRRLATIKMHPANNYKHADHSEESSVSRRVAIQLGVGSLLLVAGEHLHLGDTAEQPNCPSNLEANAVTLRNLKAT